MRQSLSSKIIYPGREFAALDYRRQILEDTLQLIGKWQNRREIAAAERVRCLSRQGMDQLHSAASDSQYTIIQQGIIMSSLTERFPGVAFGYNVQLIGLEHIHIGQGSGIGDDTWLNVAERDGSSTLRIGHNVLIGRHSMISTASNLEIGDYCLFAPRVYVSNADHGFADITRPYMMQAVTGGGSIIVEENCWLCINAVVTGSVVVGRGSVVAANAVVKSDVPPFCVVAGIPARIVKMFNPFTATWESVRSSEEAKRLLAQREGWKMPDREAYRLLLTKRGGNVSIHPALVGGSFHI